MIIKLCLILPPLNSIVIKNPRRPRSVDDEVGGRLRRGQVLHPDQKVGISVEVDVANPRSEKTEKE